MQHDLFVEPSPAFITYNDKGISKLLLLGSALTLTYDLAHTDDVQASKPVKMDSKETHFAPLV